MFNRIRSLLNRPPQGEGDQSMRPAPDSAQHPLASATVISPSQGANPLYTGEAIISIPEGGGYTPKQTKQGIISMPGDDHMGMDMERPPRREQLQPANGKPVDIVIYFMDKSGVHLTVEDGQNAEAGELFEMVMEEMKFAPAARDVFSLWLVSDFLELQLKPTHIPFKLACYWEELLEKYTSAEEEDVERDEPVIMFQRNVFFTRAKERKIRDPEILRLLYHEAKENVVDARYPISQSDCDYLAGLQALLKHRCFDGQEHDEEYYKNFIGDYYPPHYCKRRWSFPGRRVKDNPEQRLVQFHRAAYKKFGGLEAQEARVAVYLAYLTFCWKLPYYGAAFFSGQVEHPGRKIMGSVDDPVYVAINTDGVFIIDMDDVVFLLGLLYEDMTWEYAEPKNKDNRNCMPCLFLQFGEVEEGKKVTKVLQVFSREAVLMDNIIDACVRRKVQMREDRSKRASTAAADNVDGDASFAKDDDDDGIIKPEGDTWAQFNRLCLATFDKKGQCIDANIRKPKPTKSGSVKK